MIKSNLYKIDKASIDDFNDLSSAINSLETLKKIFANSNESIEEKNKIRAQIFNDEKKYLERLRNWWTAQIIKNFIITYEDNPLIIDFEKNAIKYTNPVSN